MSHQLFKRISTMTGLSPLLAPGTVRRSLASVGVTDPESASPADYLRALPQIARRLKVYLPATEAVERIQAIQEMVEAQPS